MLELSNFGVNGNPFAASSGFWLPPAFFWLAAFFTVVLLVWIAYSLISHYQLTKEGEVAFDKYFIKAPVRKRTNDRWEKVKAMFNSGDPNQWRLAIIEADVMLEELLIQLGYEGHTVAERLKSIEPSDFPTLQYAWEAHKVRNRIAHDGTNFQVTPDLAAQTMRQFEYVFEDSRYI